MLLYYEIKLLWYQHKLKKIINTFEEYQKQCTQLAKYIIEQENNGSYNIPNTPIPNIMEKVQFYSHEIQILNKEVDFYRRKINKVYEQLDNNMQLNEEIELSLMPT
jgi:flagellar biosynthesis chaperone FliJ